jgi:DNA-binding XRE family transcriptional regulator
LFLIIAILNLLYSIRNIMPAKPPATTSVITEQLIGIGQHIRAHRKFLRISAMMAAEAAHISRVTLFRIEKGEPAVTMGAYMNVMAALGLNFGVVTPAEPNADRQMLNCEEWIPARIFLSNYPQLKQLAWQVHGVETLSPTEAWDIYERNWRHLDKRALTLNERQLIDALRLAFGGGNRHV